jgi:hypothetical protein
MAALVQYPKTHVFAPNHPALPHLLLIAAAADADAALTTDSSDKAAEPKQQQQRKPKNANSSGSSDQVKASRMQANTLYVQNLAWATLSEDLQEAFRNNPGFEDAFIMMNKNDRPAGYGFVKFSSEEAAKAAEAVRKEATDAFGVLLLC